MGLLESKSVYWWHWQRKMLYTVWDSFETLVSIANIFTNTESKETKKWQAI